MIYILFLHLVADFWFQDRETAKKKSENFMFLAKHIAIVYSVFCVGMLAFIYFKGDLLTTYPKLFIFCAVNAILHGVIDWNIWKLYKLWTRWRNPDVTHGYAYWEDSNFYLTIGVDQFLHTSILVLLYNFLLHRACH